MPKPKDEAKNMPVEIDTRIIGCTCLKNIAKNGGYIEPENCKEHKHLVTK